MIKAERARRSWQICRRPSGQRAFDAFSVWLTDVAGWQLTFKLRFYSTQRTQRFCSCDLVVASSMARKITTGRSVTTTEMDWKMGCFGRNQLLSHRELFHRTFLMWPTLTLVVNVKPLENWPESMYSHLVRWNHTSVPSFFEAHFRRLCHILWTIIQIWNFPAACQPYTWLMTRILPGLGCRAHAKKEVVHCLCHCVCCVCCVLTRELLLHPFRRLRQIICTAFALGAWRWMEAKL